MAYSRFDRSTLCAFATLLLTACPSGKDAEPPPVAETGTTEPDTGSTTDSPPETTEESGTADSEPSGTESSESGGGSESGAVDDCVINEDGCFGEDCVPTVREHLLNRCTAATCEPFANTPERLPRLNSDGTLPPLP